jgi:hypothetical protein
MLNHTKAHVIKSFPMKLLKEDHLLSSIIEILKKLIHTSVNNATVLLEDNKSYS